MAIISDYEDERNDTAASSASKTLPFKATFDSTNPLGIVQSLFDFLANECDFLDKDTADKEIAAAVKAARDKFKRKKSEEKEREPALKKSTLEDEKNKSVVEEEKVESKSKDEKKEESSAVVPNKGNGLDLEKYSWTQTLQEVNVQVPVPSGTKSRFVVCDIKKNHLKVGLKGQPPIIEAKTRNQFYGESSQFSSNIAYKSRLKQGKRQQRTGKRKKRTEDKSCFMFDGTHIKRPRFHMAQPKRCRSIRDEVQKFLGDYTPDPMSAACHANRDAFIKLLLSACDRTDDTMGSPNMPEIFWKKFTKRWVQDLKLDIEITEETVAACESFGSYLKKKHLEMEKTSRAFEKHRREQYIQPLELKQSLFKIFGSCKPRFRRTNSTGSSSKSSTSSDASRFSDASRLSDARWPSGASQSLRQDVNDDWNEWEPHLADALDALYSANLMNVADVDLVSVQFRRSTTRVGLRIFLGMPLPDQVQYIRNMLANPPVV